MIFSTYHVFGSGSSGTVSFARPSMRLSEVSRAFAELAEMKTNDGDNDFMGTYSVPDEEAVKRGVWRECWAYPGGGKLRCPADMVEIGWGVSQIRKFANVLDVTAGTLAAIMAQVPSREHTADVISAALERRKKILAVGE